MDCDFLSFFATLSLRMDITSLFPVRTQDFPFFLPLLRGRAGALGNGRIISGDNSIQTVDPDVATEVEEVDIENDALATHLVLELATGVRSEVIVSVETRESILLEMIVIELDSESVLKVDSDRGVTKVAIFEFTEDTFEQS